MKILNFGITFFVSFLLAFNISGQQKGYYRSPAISGHEVVFTAEGDLWKYDLISKKHSD